MAAQSLRPLPSELLPQILCEYTKKFCVVCKDLVHRILRSCLAQCEMVVLMFYSLSLIGAFVDRPQNESTVS